MTDWDAIESEFTPSAAPTVLPAEDPAATYGQDTIPTGAPDWGAVESQFSAPQRNETPVRLAALKSMAVEPDQYAEARRLSGITGVPADVVVRNMADVKKRAYLAGMGPMMDRAPDLARMFVDNSDFAKLSRDDLDVLGQVPDTFSSAMALESMRHAGGKQASLTGSVFGDTSRAGEIASRLARAGGAAPFSLFSGVANLVAVPFDIASYPFEKLAELGILPEGNPFQTAAAGFRELGQSEKRAAEYVQGDLSDAGLVERAVYSGIQSFGEQLPGLVASVMTGNPTFALGGAAASSGGKSYGEAKVAGVDTPTALLFGASDAAIEWWTERLPILRTLEGVQSKAGIVRTIIETAPAEVFGEQAATALQDFNAWAVLNPEKTLETYLAERPSAAASTLVSTLVGTAAQVTAAQAVSTVAERFGRNDQAIAKSEESLAFLQSLTDIANASKLAERSPETFQDYIDTVAKDTPVTDVYVDGKQFIDALNQSGVTPELLSQVSIAAATQLEEAQAGGQVRLTVGEFAAHFARSDLGAKLLPHLKTSPQDFSQEEAKAFMKDYATELQQETEGQIAGAEAAAVEQQQTATVRDQYRKMLGDTGRFRPEVVDQYAGFMSAFYGTMAKRAGTTPDALFQQFPVQVQGIGQAGGLEQGASSPLADLWERYENPQNDSFMSSQELLEEVFTYHETQEDLPTEVMESAEAYREALREDFEEHAGRGDVEPHEEAFLDAVARASSESRVMVREAQPRNNEAPEGAPRLRQIEGQFLRARTKRDDILSQSGLRDATGSDLAKRAAAEFLGKPLANTETGIEATVSNSSLGKMLSASAVRNSVSPQAHMMAVANLDRLFPLAIRRLERAPNREEDAGRIDAIHHFDAPMPFNGEVLRVKMLVKEVSSPGQGGNRLYTVSAVEIDEAPVVKGGVDLDAGASTPLSVPPGGFGDRFAQLVEDVKAGRLFGQADGTAGSLRGGIAFGSGSGPVNLDLGASIALPERADLTTFLHESGHFYLEVLLRLASRPAAPQQLLDDANTALSFMGIPDLASWQAMDLNARREGHEKWAETFEEYLMSGAAPSLELHGLFQRFAAWLKAIYRAMKPGQRSALNPEIRQVFDRMLATDEQIAEAEGARYAPIYRTAEEANMTPEAFAAYQALGDQATQNAVEKLQARSLQDLKWLSGAKGRALRTAQRAATAKRRTIRAEVAEEVLSGPLYQAMRFLRTGQVEGVEPEGDLPHKLDLGVLEEMYEPKSRPKGKPVTAAAFGEAARLQFLRTIRGKGGIEIREATDLTGETTLQAALRVSPGLFRKDGMTLDVIAQDLSPEGTSDPYIDATAFADVDGGLAVMRDLIAAAINGEPVMTQTEAAEYAVLVASEKGADPAADAEIAAEREAIRLAEAPDYRELARLRMAGLDGVAPDVVAELFGFTSGDHLVRQILAAEPEQALIDRLTDERMLERYGDLTSPGALERAAGEAVHNAARARFVATELNAIRQAAGRPKVLIPAIRQFAERIINGKRIRDVRPAQYEAAEAAAARAAVKAMAGKKAGKKKTGEATPAQEPGNLAEAALQKRNQLIQHYAAKAAYEAQDEVERGVRYLRKFGNAGTRAGLRGEFLEQLDALLDRFDLRSSVSLKKLDSERVALAEWIESEAERLAAIAPDLPANLLNDAFRKNYRELTVYEFRGLVDGVRQLEKMARRENKMYQEQREMSFDAERKAILDRMRAFTPEAFDADGAPKEIAPDFVPSLRKAAGKVGEKFQAEFLNVETMVNLLEGGEFGQIAESLFGRISKAADDKGARLGNLYKQLKPFFDQYSRLEKLTFGRRGYYIDAAKTSVTRENALVVYLLNGSEDGRKRLANYGWGPAQVNAIIDILDERDAKLADAIWRMFDETLWPDLEALNKRTRGSSPPKVPPLPFQTKFGTARGGYFRLKYDTELDERAHHLAEGAEVKELLGGTRLGMSAKTNQGTSITRLDKVAMRPRLDLGVMSEAINETVHDIALREAVADTIKLLNHEDIRAAVKSTLGVTPYRAMVQWVRDMAAPPRNPSGFIEKAATVARRNTVVTLMSGVRTALLNLTGFLPALTRVNGGLMVRETARFFSPQMVERYRFATGKSEYMRQRFSNYDRDLHTQASQFTVNGRLMPDTATMLALMGFVDRAMATSTWNAAYAQGMREFSNDDAKAIEYADHMVRQTQGSGRDVDLAAIMRGHGGWGALKKLLTMFSSYSNGQLGQLVRAGVIGKREAKTAPVLASYKFAARVIGILILPALINEFTNGSGGDDDDDDWAKRSIKAITMYGASMFPIVRDLYSYTWSRFDPDSPKFGYRLSPVQAAGEGIVLGVESGIDFAMGDGDDKDLKKVIMGVSFGVGGPGKLVADTTLGTKAWLEGDAEPQAVLFGPPRQ